MEIRERLSSLASKIETQGAGIETEEATKNAFVMPFISLVLGYDVFNPHEVIPEFTADVGTKRGEKIDYAIMNGDEVQILIECKRHGDVLNLKHASQLFRYFAVTHARIALLTNGDDYHFYTDLDAPNRMDEKPFLVLKVTDLDANLIPELTKLAKGTFDLESVLNAAEELKYIGELKRVLGAQFVEPDVEWVRFLTSQVYGGPFTQRVREQFSGLVVKAHKQFLADRVNDRLKAALGGQPVDAVSVGDSLSEPVAEADLERSEAEADGILTTLEEIEAFQIVRAIVCSEVAVGRVAQRDTKSYFGVLLDDNNRKPIARLHFNTSQRYLGTFDKDKNETRHPIATLDEIYEHAETLRETVHYYD
ncbi:restriction endonuclease [Aeromicrobium sp. PE09-221]|uniref:type I restriction endonuclease n=1 Tax=Aeromicrobium sp. PE09-221 TaxID=1898043 RepID=UPI000B3E95BB|nr:type I restriction endonuclease [Aeromicrobium sp. PE09-221]OUZ08857.1 restriction endonuclease [Aeromicrobium sp. PE09-221]